ncbi:MAG: helix-turn-helix domain-containing protein [Actinomycetota bacterium]|nr:helix-turn-helix domain-containing protein [Actinomycetota bacterium]
MTESVATSVLGVPAPPLHGLVDSYVGYHFDGFEPGVHIGKPSRHLTLVIDFDGPLRVTASGSSAAMASSYDTSIGGLHGSPIAIHHDGRQFGANIQLSPAGARSILGMPASELASTIAPLDAVLGAAPTAELRERLVTTPSWDERFALLDRTLVGLVRSRAPGPRPEVARAWDRLVATGGAVGVAALAEEVSWSRRHLTACFRAEFGVTPKLMGRILRFERAVELFGAPAPATLADIAATCGYADQAHLVRDWRDFTGASPTGWLAAETLPMRVEPDLVPTP